MVKSTFISSSFHIFVIILAYYGLPAYKAKEIIEQPIDIVEDIPISSKTALKLGKEKKKKEKKTKKKTFNEEKLKKTPPLPPLPSKKIIEKKKQRIRKIKRDKKNS